MRIYPVYPMVKELLDEYKQRTLSDMYHKSGTALTVSLECNKRTLRDGLRIAKTLGYPYK